MRISTALIVAVFACSANAGYRATTSSGTEILISDGRIRTSIPALGFLRGFDPARGRFWIANTNTRTFWQGTVEEYCADAKRTQDEMTAPRMTNIPPEQRRMMEEHMRRQQSGPQGAAPEPPPAKPVKVTIERTDERRTIGGQEVRKVRVLADGQLHEELWLTVDSQVARTIDYAKVMETERRVRECVGGDAQARREREMAAYPEYVRRAMDPSGQMEKNRIARAVQASSEYATLMGEGMPLTVEVTAIESRDIPTADLEPPPGFRPARPDEVMGAPANVLR